MQVTSNPAVLEADVERAVESTRGPLEEAVRAAVTSRTGRYRANTHVAREGTSLRVVNSTPYSDALEFGADVGSRRGPHMKGEHAIERTVDARFGPLLEGAFRSR